MGFEADGNLTAVTAGHRFQKRILLSAGSRGDPPVPSGDAPDVMAADAELMGCSLRSTPSSAFRSASPRATPASRSSKAPAERRAFEDLHSLVPQAPAKTSPFDEEQEETEETEAGIGLWASCQASSAITIWSGEPRPPKPDSALSVPLCSLCYLLFNCIVTAKKGSTKIKF